jgi:hypothetical protein
METLSLILDSTKYIEVAAYTSIWYVESAHIWWRYSGTALFPGYRNPNDCVH